MAEAKRSGVSVIVCCHNSAAQLPRTLEHLTRQLVNPAIDWEVVVVDNASTDGTAELALQLWKPGSVGQLRVVTEPRLGLAYARLRGVEEARYDILAFADDDNWLCPGWVQTVHDVMLAHPEIGALGGIVEPVFESARPDWFAPVAYLYALGPDNEPSGDVTGTHMLCGAGLNVRYSALTDIRNKGFRPIAVGRQGTSLGAGEDSEMTYFLRLAGWRLWIDPRLRLGHFLPERRLNWAYALRLAYGSAFATPERDALVYACKPPRSGWSLRARVLRERWFWQVTNVFTGMLRSPVGLVKRALGAGGDGDPAVLQVEFLRGRFDGLRAARRWYDGRSREIRGVMKQLGERAGRA